MTEPNYKASDLPFPPHWINEYLYKQLSKYEGINMSEGAGINGVVPIFAVTPTNTEEIYKNLTQSIPVEQPLLIQYDRLIRFRTNSFYPRKREQLLYYLYSTDLATVNYANILISQLLDREDASAQDLNNYDSSLSLTRNVFFHATRVYQADETRDVIELASARTVFINKLIIEYDYHANWGELVADPNKPGTLKRDDTQNDFK
jgi:hypothetical protein